MVKGLFFHGKTTSKYYVFMTKYNVFTLFICLSPCCIFANGYLKLKFNPLNNPILSVPFNFFAVEAFYGGVLCAGKEKFI